MVKKKGVFATTAVSVIAVLVLLWGGATNSYSANPTTHTIFINIVEIKGATTTDKLAPPTDNPKDLSKGYGYKAPGDADKNDPKKWEVASYMFSPGFVTARRGDTINLTAFVVNGDKHEVWITDPSGKKVLANVVWNRGRQYEFSFTAQHAGVYELVCSDHAPSMIAKFLILP